MHKLYAVRYRRRHVCIRSFLLYSVVERSRFRKRRVFRGINPNLDAGCSMHSECSSQSGLLSAIGVHRGTWLPGESTSTFAAFCVHVCTSLRVQELRAHVHPVSYIRVQAWGEILPDRVARSVNVLHCVICHVVWDNVVPQRWLWPDLSFHRKKGHYRRYEARKKRWSNVSLLDVHSWNRVYSS